jgi:RNase H-fold protein (predicted Holliday junction resolvase)
MKIVSIDPGTRNCGVCVYENGELTHFASYDLFEYVSKKQLTDYPTMARNFVDRSGLFENVDVVLIENQMQARMKMLACAWRCFFWGKSVRISPLAVHNHFKSGHGKYSKNKKAAIQLVGRFLNEKQKKMLFSNKKKDDCADSIIQLHYYLEKNKKNKL